MGNAGMSSTESSTAGLKAPRELTLHDGAHRVSTGMTIGKAPYCLPDVMNVCWYERQAITVFALTWLRCLDTTTINTWLADVKRAVLRVCVSSHTLVCGCKAYLRCRNNVQTHDPVMHNDARECGFKLLACDTCERQQCEDGARLESISC